MLDAKYFREELDNTAKTLAKRGFELDVAKLSKLDCEAAEVKEPSTILLISRGATAVFAIGRTGKKNCASHEAHSCSSGRMRGQHTAAHILVAGTLCVEGQGHP